jgi:hypothetical protein
MTEEHIRKVAVAVLVITLQHLIGRIYNREKALADTPKLIDEVASVLHEEFPG